MKEGWLAFLMNICWANKNDTGVRCEEQ
jgi:hypothetical protein